MTVPAGATTPPPPPPFNPVPPPAAQVYGPPAAVRQRKVARSWSGALLALAAILLGVGSCLPWEKLVVFLHGRVLATLSLTGLGSITTTGDHSIRQLVSTPGANGKFEIGIAAVLLVFAVLVVAGKGRLWVGIVSAVLAATGLLVAVLNISAVSKDDTKLNRFMQAQAQGGAGHALARIGLDVAVIGAAATLVAALLVLIVRRPRTV